MLLTVLLAALTGQLLQKPIPHFREFRNDGVGRLSRLGQTQTLPYFYASLSSSSECNGASLSNLTLTRPGSYSCPQSSAFLVSVAANQPSTRIDGTDFFGTGTNATISYTYTATDTKVIELVAVPDKPWTAMAAAVTLQWGTFNAANSANFMIQNGIIIYREWDAGGSTVLAVATAAALGEGPRRIRLVIPPTGACTVYVDGVVVSSTASPNTGRMVTPPTTIRVGGIATDSFVWTGRIRDICLAKNTLYCFGAAPGEQSGRRIVAIGDSTTGSTINVTWPTRLQWKFGYTSNLVQNAGFGSTTAAQMLTVWTNNVRGKGYTTLLLLGGVNDINRDAQPASVPWTSLKTIIDQAKADGMTVGVSTVLPFSATGSKATELASLNSTITSYAGANGLILLDGYTIMGDGAGHLLPAYNVGDDLHLSEAGIRALGDAWYAVLP